MRFLVSTLSLGAMTVSLGATGCTAAVTAHHVLPAEARPATSNGAADQCAGLPAVEQERPSFLRAQGIEAVRPVVAERPATKFTDPELLGAEIVLRPDTTVTKFWVARVLRCHLADPVAVALSGGFEDPLIVGTPAVSLDESSSGRVVLRIAGRSGAEGEEILRRAEQLYRSE